LALRPGAIFGETETRHLPRIKMLIKLGFFRVAFGDADAKQDWLHVDNLVSAIILAAKRMEAPQAAVCGKAYFINDDEPVNTLQFFGPLARALGRSDKPLFRVPLSLALAAGWLSEQGWYRLGIPPFLTRAEVVKSAVQHTFSCRRAREELAYFPTLNSTQGMARVAAAHAVPLVEGGYRLFVGVLLVLLGVALAAMCAAWPSSALE